MVKIRHKKATQKLSSLFIYSIDNTLFFVVLALAYQKITTFPRYV